MSDIIDLSIIIISYNTKGLLINCLKSIEKFIEDIRYEVIIVDNASVDGSPESVERDFPQYNLIKNNENYGFAKANNQGFRIAKGRAILMLNSDTFFVETGIKEMFEYLWSDSTIGILAPRLLNADGSIQNSCRKFFSFFRTNYEPPDRLLSRLPDFANQFFHIHNVHKMFSPSDIDYGTGAALLIKRNIIEKIGGLDENFFFYGEETDFCFQAHKLGYRVVYYPFFRIIHLRGASSNKAPNYFSIYHRYKSKYYYLKKNHPYIVYRIFWLRKLIQVFLTTIYSSIKRKPQKYQINKKILAAHFKEF